MAKNRIFLDVETSGLKALQNQVLEYAAIAVDANGFKLDSIEVRIRLKSFVRPEPGALAANKINPFSEDWKKNSIEEERAAELLADFCEKHSINGNRPTFTAYNAMFDKDHISMMFKRHGIDFDSHFDGVSDPLKTAKRLVGEGKIVTRFISKGKGGYHSAKLEDVSEALGTKSEGPAHRAMSDTVTLMNTFFKLYALVTGKSYGETKANPELYEEGQILNIISDSSESGLKLRHIKVIRNNKNDHKLVAFDLDDYERIGLCPSNVRTFNYETIIDQSEIEFLASTKLEEVFISNKSYIDSKL